MSFTNHVQIIFSINATLQSMGSTGVCTNTMSSKASKLQLKMYLFGQGS